MRNKQLRRAYHPKPVTFKSVVHLDSATSHHLIHVLRMRPLEMLELFDGTGWEHQVQMIHIEDQIVSVRLIQSRLVPQPNHVSIEIAQGIARPEHMDYVIQKSTELGVQCITPIWSEYCSMARKNFNRMSHWHKTMIHACEQSRRSHVPHFNDPCVVQDYLMQQTTARKLMCTPYGLCTSWDQLRHQAPPRAVRILIGPEGGFSCAEIEAAQDCGYQTISLGPRTMRTETAAIVAVTLIQAFWGDLCVAPCDRTAIAHESSDRQEAVLENK